MCRREHDEDANLDALCTSIANLCTRFGIMAIVPMPPVYCYSMLEASIVSR